MNFKEHVKQFYEAYMYRILGTIIMLLLLGSWLTSISAVDIFFNSFQKFLNSIEFDSAFAFQYVMIAFLFLCLIATLIIFHILQFRCIRYLLGMAFLSTVITISVLEHNASKLIVFCASLYILLIVHELLVKNQTALTYLFPYLLITGLLICFLPSKPEPAKWSAFIITKTKDVITWVDNRVSYIFPGGKGEFGITMAGYSENGLIKSKLNSFEKDVLEVRHYYNAQNFYLTGTVMDTYTGNGWVRSQNLDDADYPEHNLDLLEFALALYDNTASLSNQEELYDMLAVRNIEINYIETHTQSLFYPLKVERISTEDKIDTKGASMFFEKTKEKNIKYRARYLEINYQNNIVHTLLQNGTDYYEIEPTTLKQYLNGLPGENLSFIEIPTNYTEVLEKRKSSIYDFYTALPETVPKRVYDLTNEITAECSGTYEKMKAIETYLNDFSYTLTPPEMPESDFADWFLFEAQEGYCTYFSTAMAVMGRTQGIPVRYVQGYALQSSNSNITIIKNKNAHAWTEAYIDGVGWIPFEASPSFSNLRYSEWKNKPPTQINSTAYSTDFEIPNSEQPNEVIQTEEKPVFSSILIVIIIMVVITLTLLICRIYLLLQKRSYKNMGAKNYFLLNLKFILFLLRINGNPILAGETLQAFSKRLSDIEFCFIASSHERIMYQDMQVNEQDITAITHYKENLYNQMKGKANQLKYLLYILRK